MFEGHILLCVRYIGMFDERAHFIMCPLHRNVWGAHFIVCPLYRNVWWAGHILLCVRYIEMFEGHILLCVRYIGMFDERGTFNYVSVT